MIDCIWRGREAAGITPAGGEPVGTLSELIQRSIVVSFYVGTLMYWMILQSQRFDDLLCKFARYACVLGLC